MTNVAVPEVPPPTRGFDVERKGIEFVPTSERYGTPRRLFTIWFSVNLSILCLTVGTLGVLAGLPLIWTLCALVVGNVVGTVFMAAHSAQGPHLGIPQMIQSRAQFGVIGAALPLFAVVASAVFYTAANAILIGDTVRMILPVTNSAAELIFGLLTLLISFIGYELIHRIGAALSIVSGALFIGVVVLLLGHTAVPSQPPAAAHFSVATFILVVTQATAWSLSSAPSVADYSRYLPTTVSPWEAFWYTGMGNFLSSTLIMALGAYMASAYPYLAAHPGVGMARLFGPGQGIAAFVIVFNLLQVNVMTLYSGYMSTVTIITGAHGMERVSLRLKFTLMAGLLTLTTLTALATQNNFDRYFSDLLAILLYTLVPWSAINLADYYLVRKGSYFIDQMFNIDGVYGAYRWKAIGVYLLSIALQVPFMNLSFYVGPVARLLDADIAWLPGTVIPTLLYVLVERRAASTDADSLRYSKSLTYLEDQ
jgi:NCS1 family nucleobase:cation symporter-1